MALINQFGHQYPCQTEGQIVEPGDDTAEIYDGDIAEIILDSDIDITYKNTVDAFEEILKMKEEYPDFALHYVRFETRRIYVQFSCAPYQGNGVSGISGEGVALAWYWILAIVVGSLVALFYAVVPAALQMFRGYIWHKPLPIGRAEVTARDRVTNLPLADVEITCGGETEVTGPNGEAAYFDNLLQGNHTFIGAVIAGYDPPTPISAYVTADHTIDVLIPYNPEGVVPPTQGWLNIDTDPVKGIIYLDGIELGEAPQPQYVSIGDHTVAFGEVEGYITPVQQVVTVLGDPYLTPCIGYYISPESWWEKFLWYGLTATAIIAGGAVLLPRLIKSIKSRPEPKQLPKGRG